MEPRRRRRLSALFGLGLAACVALTLVGGIASGLVAGTGATSFGFASGSDAALAVPPPAIAVGGLLVGLGAAGGFALRRQRQLQRQIDSIEDQLQQTRARATGLEQDCEGLAAEGQKLAATVRETLTEREQILAEARDREATLAAELEELRQQLAETQARNGRDLQAIEADVAETWDENERLQEELNRVRQHNEQLAVELDSARSNLENAWKYASPDRDGAATPPDADSDDTASDAIDDDGQAVGSVLAALEAADAEFGDVLTIWDSALESAVESQFGRPGDVYQALAALAAIGRDYFEAADRGEAMGSWRDAFRQYGLDFKPTEHQVTRSMYGQDRDFRHQGRKQRMLKHVTLGRNNTVHTLQIYFEVDREARKLDIGYCGKHLRCYRWAS